MALDARTRSSLYHSLAPVIGDDNANALMSEFPSVEADELVTKEFLRAELALEIGGLRTEIAHLENRLTLRMGAGFAAMTAILATLITVR